MKNVQTYEIIDPKDVGLDDNAIVLTARSGRAALKYRLHVDGKCPDCGREVKPAKEEAYFFKMSKYADRLIDYINTHP